MSETKHTPLPWQFSGDAIWGYKHTIVVADRSMSDANAAFIVRAANHFEELRQMLHDVIGVGDFNSCEYPEVLRNARALLAKLEEK